MSSVEKDKIGHELENTILDCAKTLFEDWEKRLEIISTSYDAWVMSDKASLSPMAAIFGATRQLKDTLTDLTKIVSDMHTKQANLDLPAAFNAIGDTTSIANSYGTIYMTQRKSASIQDREKAMEWLREVGLGELIQPSVNAATLSAALKDFDHDPDPEVIKISLHTLAAIRGKTKKG